MVGWLQESAHVTKLLKDSVWIFVKHLVKGTVLHLADKKNSNISQFVLTKTSQSSFQITFITKTNETSNSK